MEWSYNHLNGIAEQSGTGMKFRVDRDMADDQVSVATVDGQPHGLDYTNFQALASVCVSERNRHELQGLIQTIFQNDFSRAVVALNKADGRKASVRTLQAWLMQPGKQSSRRCPTWAVSYLKNYRDTHAEEIRIYREFKESQIGLKTPTRADRVYNGSALEDIECQLAREEQYRQELRSCSISMLPDMIADKLLKIESNYDRLLSIHFALLQSIRNAETLEQLKAKLNEEEDDLSQSHHFLATTRQALQSNAEEFASDDGTLPEEAGLLQCVFPGNQ